MRARNTSRTASNKAVATARSRAAKPIAWSRASSAIDRYEARARADGVVTPQERQRLDHMLDREGRNIYRAEPRSPAGLGSRPALGHTDGRMTAVTAGAHDGWGRHGRDRGQHEGWTRGEHNGWDGNRPPGIERRDARDDRRIQNGIRDGSLTARRGQPAGARPEPYRPLRSTCPLRRRRDAGRAQPHRQHAEPREPADLCRPPQRSHDDHADERHAADHRLAQLGQRWLASAAGGQHDPDDRPAARHGGSHNWNGFRTQQAAATPTATPRPTMTRASAPSTGARSWGGRH